MRIMLFGAPGAGKGTQGDRLAKLLNVPRLSTGDMLRAQMRDQTAIGKLIMDLMPTGQLIGDDVVIQLLKARIQQPDCNSGYILDGFPRTVFQASAMNEAGIGVDAIVELCVDEDAIVLRMAGRQFHAPSGRSYHKDLNPPLTEGFDDVTQEALTTRPEDSESVVRERLMIYQEQTAPVLDYFRQLEGLRPAIHRVDAMGTVDHVAKNISEELAVAVAIAQISK
jgi:adenylate kinase